VLQERMWSASRPALATRGTALAEGRTCGSWLRSPLLMELMCEFHRRYNVCHPDCCVNWPVRLP
jgi:hypothetical protein